MFGGLIRTHFAIWHAEGEQHGRAGHGNVPCRGGQRPGKQAQQRAFAAPVRARQAQPPAGVQREGKPVKHGPCRAGVRKRKILYQSQSHMACLLFTRHGPGPLRARPRCRTGALPESAPLRRPGMRKQKSRGALCVPFAAFCGRQPARPPAHSAKKKDAPARAHSGRPIAHALCTKAANTPLGAKRNRQNTPAAQGQGPAPGASCPALHITGYCASFHTFLFETLPASYHMAPCLARPGR